MRESRYLEGIDLISIFLSPLSAEEIRVLEGELDLRDMGVR